MSSSFRTDPRGVLVPCADCATVNRVPYSRLGQHGRCAACQKDLPALTLPVEITSIEAFAGLVGQSVLPVVVDFWAEWCGPCKMMAPEFAKAAAQTSGQAIFAKLDTEAVPEVGQRLRIQGIPAFILFYQGKERDRTSGFQPAPQLLAWAASSLAAADGK